ncbi:ABC transporter, ATP-binding protein [Melioribacter roseus P3M-2]|uniref:ABC transporter, ATP-binding protein n=1 Tax=Melioribacter roseus (strain DSM 23840 / JCM 17771 / VKM B-2668 / P3M-2) TaxID=1191523 RepID=I6ZYJ2_MELRP|nr:ABC transporter ATP-binding protein [Melioribacter roseus]AFN74093.1 ABC transporter, ATP-binding protein [Melioribacter roseus P3M-2]
MNDTIIEINGLTKKFGSLTAVDNLDLKVYKGDIFGFLGPNGAGKSTTIRMLLSLIKPTSGSIKIFGLSVKRDRKNIMRRIGAIVEKPDFYLYLTAYKNLEILGRLSGADISKNKIMEMLELVGLASRHNSKVKTFSHGMKQRLGLAQALLHDPELIILDEPTTGLDPQGMKEIRELILYLSRSKGKTIFLSSHILHEVEMIANRMIIINKGKKIVEGNVADLLRSDKMNVSFEVSDPLKASEIIKEIAEGGEFHPGSNKITLSLTQKEISELNKKLVENGIEVYSIVPVRSLEEYFLKITEGANND